MRYLKLFLASIPFLFLTGVVIWTWIFFVFFSTVFSPVIAWWKQRKSEKNKVVILTENKEKKSASEDSYRVIEAEYKILDK